ncbi:unnamed protein product, partial [Oppiella nova]
MAISGETIEKISALMAQMCCPLCGKNDQKISSLTACGHYLCSKCVLKHVLETGNKCPKCYAINYTNDCKDDLYMNSVLKVGLRMSRLLDQRQSKESVKQVVTKPREEPPKAHSSGYRKDLIIERFVVIV